MPRSLKLDFISRNTTVRLKPHALELVARVLSPETISSIQEISEEIIRQLARAPEDLYALSSRRFEEIICELFQDFGYDAHLTPQTRHGGRDVLAVLSTPMGKELTIVECKRYKKSVKIGVDVVQRLLWVAR